MTAITNLVVALMIVTEGGYEPVPMLLLAEPPIMLCAADGTQLPGAHEQLYRKAPAHTNFVYGSTIPVKHLREDLEPGDVYNKSLLGIFFDLGKRVEFRNLITGKCPNCGATTRLTDHWTEVIEVPDATERDRDKISEARKQRLWEGLW